VSRTLYKGLFCRAGPRVSMLPRTRRNRAPAPPKNVPPTIPLFSFKVCNFEQSHHGVRGNTVACTAFFRGGHGLAPAPRRHSDPHDRLFPANEVTPLGRCGNLVPRLVAERLTACPARTNAETGRRKNGPTGRVGPMGETQKLLRSLELYTRGTLPEPLCASSVRMSRIVALHRCAPELKWAGHAKIAEDQSRKGESLARCGMPEMWRFDSSCRGAAHRL
jgi:hypothetical protein